MYKGKAFGELAILYYNCTRTATIRAVTDADAKVHMVASVDSFMACLRMCIPVGMDIGQVMFSSHYDEHWFSEAQ